MLKLWNKAKELQLDLLDAAPAPDPAPAPAPAEPAPSIEAARRIEPPAPQMLPLAVLCEDPANPRTEFPESELDELAEDIRQHGILQPIVVHPADLQGQHCIHFGAKRWRAAQRAGLTEVPVVVRDTPPDPYTQVAENQKRHGLTPMDLARFIKSRVDAGASNAEVAKRLGMNLTTVAHRLALLGLPPELDEALKAGRCTSPRTLHKLSQLHDHNPKQVQELLASGSDITRTTVSALRAAVADEGEVDGRIGWLPASGCQASCSVRVLPASLAMLIFVYDDSCSVQAHDITARSLRSVDGVADVVIVSRPSRLPAAGLQVAVEPVAPDAVQ